MVRFFKVLFVIFIIGVQFQAKAQNSIAEIQGMTDDSPFNGETVTVRGIVTGTASGAGYFIQDGDSAWSGIFIYDTSRDPYPKLGDSVRLTATVEEYYNLTELKNVTEFEILSSGNSLPQPVLLAAGDIDEAYEGVLITVQDVQCTSESLGYGEWEVTDETGSVIVNDLFFAFTPTLNERYNITGPLNFTYSAFKIEPVNSSGISVATPLYFVEEPHQINADTSSVTIKWITNIPSNSVAEYGLTNDLEIDTIKVTEQTTEHEITISNLEAGQLYFIKAYSSIDEDITLPSTQSYTTVSKSSGRIEAFFNPVYYCVLEKSEYITEEMVYPIIEIINKAQKTLDIAIYDVENHASYSDDRNKDIFEAVLAKAEEGVRVRVITDDQSTHEFFTGLEVDAKIVKGNTDGIMHHKFVIVDGESMDSSWVLTGSVNWTYNNLAIDFNNLITIQDRSLAKAFTLEFNEMWGSETFEPNLDKSKFGIDKVDNTPHRFEIGGKNIELYFSPSDNTEQKIIQAIDSANYEIAFTMMAFTSDGIANALIRAYNRGVLVEYGVIDYVDYSGSEYNNLQNAGIEVHDFVSMNEEEWPEGSTVHHKYMLVDYNHPDSNPLVVTGTHNWTASADSRNDENTLFIYDYDLAQQYLMESKRIYYNDFCEGVADESNLLNIKIGPNPVDNKLNYQSEELLEEYCIYSLSGNAVQKGKLQNKLRGTITIQSQLLGQYILQLTNQSGYTKQFKLTIK